MIKIIIIEMFVKVLFVLIEIVDFPVVGVVHYRIFETDFICAVIFFVIV